MMRSPKDQVHFTSFSHVLLLSITGHRSHSQRSLVITQTLSVTKDSRIYLLIEHVTWHLFLMRPLGAKYRKPLSAGLGRLLPYLPYPDRSSSTYFGDEGLGVLLQTASDHLDHSNDQDVQIKQTKQNKNTQQPNTYQG